MKKENKMKSTTVDNNDFRSWLETQAKTYVNLKDAVASIISNLMTANQIEVLGVSGRVKDIDNAVEKATRKGYDDPKSQMTDICGVRIIVYFETDVIRVSEIIRSAFRIDEKNSSNSDDRLSANQVGYRSVHFVCDLGDDRTRLPEFTALTNLKFEFQVRTVLQHAWAELAHDRNYKFSVKLPRPLERKLFLLAGLLETADQGFDDLSKSIDHYVESVHDTSAQGNLDVEIDSINLTDFVHNWAADNNVKLYEPRSKKLTVPAVLVNELAAYGVNTLLELKNIIPKNFTEKNFKNETTVFGLVRNWMIINDPDRFLEKVKFTWVLGEYTAQNIRNFFPAAKAQQIIDQLKAVNGR